MVSGTERPQVGGEFGVLALATGANREAIFSARAQSSGLVVNPRFMHIYFGFCNESPERLPTLTRDSPATRARHEY